MNQSKWNNFKFELFNEKQRTQNKRPGETKLAETISFGEELKKCTYIILGISEDIGPQMNGGFPGAKNGFKSFLNALQTVQSNEFLKGNNIGVLGEIIQLGQFDSIESSKGQVEELDSYIEEILSSYWTKEQKLIVIGGGHNNALPIISSLNKKKGKKVHAINIDPHADCRTMEYRHSGNPFSFALENKYADTYSVFGLHESYNNTTLLNYLKEKNCLFSTFEAWLDDPIKWWQSFSTFFKHLPSSTIYSFDIDLDAIAFAPTSALTPSGFSIEEIRKFIRLIASSVDISTFHLPEGAPNNPQEERLYGKMVSYFVLDFIKSQEKR